MPGLDSNAKLLCHFDGSDGSTVIIDSSDSAHSPVANGDAQIDTAQGKFGGASLLLDGNDEVDIPDSADWDLFTATNSEFTIDFWVRFSSIASNIGFIDQWESNSRYWNLSWIQSSGLLLFNSAYTTSKLTFRCNWSPSTGTWYHVAVARSATTRFIFIDGVLQSLTADDNVALPAIAGSLNIGKDRRNTVFLPGWMDELRISDIARWTSGFTPPTTAYNIGETADVSAVALVLAQPTPAIDLISNQVIIPATLALGITAEATPHINSNVARPNAIVMGVNGADPIVEFGNEAPVSEHSMSMNVFAPTINILAQTIVTPATLAIGVTAEVAIGTPNYFFVDAPLPLLTLNASILSGFTFDRPLPMLTLSANCVVGFLTYTTQTLPMLTLNIRMGTKVDIGLPILTLVASGTNTNGGSLTKPLPLLTLNASGKSANKITFAKSLPMFTVDIVMVLGGVHIFASSLPLLRLDAEGINGNPSATFVRDLPLVTLSASGYSDGNGTLAKSLPVLILDAFGTSYLNRII
jgi:hypothetical protein